MHTYDYKYGAEYTGKNKYLIAFHKAANALINSGAGGNLKGLEDSKEIITVRGDQIKMNESAYFDYETNNIHWLPTQGLDVDEDGEGELTPTAILDHEMDHGLEFLTNSKQFFKNLRTPDKKYSNAEEKLAITGDEQKTSRKLGLISGKEKTRDNHNKGRLYQTAGVNTTKVKLTEIQEVVIKVKKKK